ncbi:MULTISPECIES: hypothetical protein [Chryseobacterium]|uniref:Lipocalin-like domain-containing protein n=1 Tax=Chryseobacterium candidae TaxID=1978493 RepID=A0ABY2R7B4_9FLAO|nr:MULTISPECIES: hypothetical protein [Chryseobacterium]PXW16600.1 hypothetical protein C8D70_10397 [Chryseobacterium sp. CBTAP 102]THV59930.1 hypothetical protein EK417_10805 [Chryseobacterium candidae]SIR43700.1 hypothetical protein SAMN05880573_12314 [Chryseobacterium sp. RU33C]
MLKNTFFLLLAASFLLVSCNYKEKEKNLTDREKQLLEKEKVFAKKESEYQSLLKMRDSIFSKKDSVVIAAVWPTEISGPWNGKVICTESNCSEYAVGDQRTDIWEFDNDSTQPITKIINNNNLVRLYTGKFENNEIRLSFKTDSTAKKNVEMSVLLNDISDNKIKGTRTITSDGCTAKFSVELVRSTK